ncbi:MAG: dihydrofolate reductase, partial [Bacteroidales bacterium]|nr:dihydrofolate reductase [Bacteroidales bacterium]
TPNATAYESYYYRYIMNGAMTQLTRIELGNNIEEAHMQDRALIANWCLKNAPEVVSLVKIDDKTYVEVKDFKALRQLFGKLLFEIQRITSEGDIKAAQELIETYAVKVDTDIHEEILNRISKLSIAPYKGFVNPLITPIYNEDGTIKDFSVSYTEQFDEQMLRYSKEFGFLK